MSVGAAFAAAKAVGTAQGLRVDDAVAVGTGSNVIGHLRPAPVVARVMTGTVVLHADPHAWLAREMDVVRFLRSRAVPVVAPTALCDAGPFLQDGLWLSLWEFAEVVETPLTGRAAGAVLRELHNALAGYDGPLPPRAAIWDEIERMLASIGDDPRLRAEADRLRPLTVAIDVDPRPLHGDASLSNLLSTPAGPRWNDFEDVCAGSLAWDLVSLEQDAVARGEDADAVRAGYGRSFDPDALETIRAVDDLYGTVWRRYLAAR